LGQSFDKVIEDEIGAARCVIVLWSRASVPSEWVRSEASEGKRRGILVPVFLDAVQAPLAFRLLQGANLLGWEPGTPHAELDKLTDRISEILTHTGSREHEREPADDRDQHIVETERRWIRHPSLIGALAFVLLAGVVYVGYLMRTPPQPLTPTGTEATSGRITEKPPAAPPADAGGLEDMLKSLGLGGGMAMTVFEIQELGLHIAFVPEEQAAAVGLSSGAVIWRIESGPAQAASLNVGDIVVAINGQKIATQDDLRRAIRAIGPGKSKYLIRRGEKTFTIEIDCRTCKVI
jgi:hypothetical protein